MNQKVRITRDKVEVRMGPGVSYAQNGEVHQGEVYTIIKEIDGFGQLKSKSGWIDLKRCRKI